MTVPQKNDSRPPQGWSEEAWSYAKSEWIEGASAGVIVDGLARCYRFSRTRNAVLGALYRAGLSRAGKQPATYKAKGPAPKRDLPVAPEPVVIRKLRTFSPAQRRGIMSGCGDQTPDRNRRAALPVPAVVHHAVVEGPPGGECWTCGAHTEIRRGRRAPFCATHMTVMYQGKAK